MRIAVVLNILLFSFMLTFITYLVTSILKVGDTVKGLLSVTIVFVGLYYSIWSLSGIKMTNIFMIRDNLLILFTNILLIILYNNLSISKKIA